MKNGLHLCVKYSENGNILFKTGVGTYKYGLKPHAVMNVENLVVLYLMQI